MAAVKDEEIDEESLIKYYFCKGYTIQEIRTFLSEYHDVVLSESTLYRRLKEYGVRRRCPEFDIDVITEEIKTLLRGPECLGGYRYVWHTLQLKGYQVPRGVVQLLLKELDPEGCEMRRSHRLKRRVYWNEGPNAAWHADGYDKLKPYGFAIHGCIDGWSRKVLWLIVTRSNNYPDNIATYFLDTVEKYGGCPVKLLTDMGTENGTMAAMQCFFRNEDNAHNYCSSPRNQRIEGFWSSLRRMRMTWWINFFKDLVESESINTGDSFTKDCLWFCFAELIQSDLEDTRKHWNTHTIRKSRQDTVSGKPDALYFLPKNYGGSDNLILTVPEQERNYMRNLLQENQENEETLEYFEYVMNACGFSKPTDWREGVDLFKRLIQISGMT